MVIVRQGRKDNENKKGENEDKDPEVQKDSARKSSNAAQNKPAQVIHSHAAWYILRTSLILHDVDEQPGNDDHCREGETYAENPKQQRLRETNAKCKQHGQRIATAMQQKSSGGACLADASIIFGTHPSYLGPIQTVITHNTMIPLPDHLSRIHIAGPLGAEPIRAVLLRR